MGTRAGVRDQAVEVCFPARVRPDDDYVFSSCGMPSWNTNFSQAPQGVLEQSSERVVPELGLLEQGAFHEMQDRLEKMLGRHAIRDSRCVFKHW